MSDTTGIVSWLRGYGRAQKDRNYNTAGDYILEAADHMEELDSELQIISDRQKQLWETPEYKEFCRYWQEKHGLGNPYNPMMIELLADWYAMKQELDGLKMTHASLELNHASMMEELNGAEEAAKRWKKVAHKLHIWIFHHVCDEEAAYREAGLTEEDDMELGWGSITIQGEVTPHENT